MAAIPEMVPIKNVRTQEGERALIIVPATPDTQQARIGRQPFAAAGLVDKPLVGMGMPTYSKWPER